MHRFTLVALALALAVPTGSAAQMPEDACYLMALDAAALAAQPGRGVQALAVEFRPLTDWERETKGYWRHVRLSARMAGQGQALRDRAMGATLTATAECRAQTMTCWTDNDGAHFTLRFHEGGRMELRTRNFPVADYGGSMTESNLAEGPEHETVYLLDPVPMAECDLP